MLPNYFFRYDHIHGRLLQAFIFLHLNFIYPLLKAYKMRFEKTNQANKQMKTAREVRYFVKFFNKTWKKSARFIALSTYYMPENERKMKYIHNII